MDPAGPLTYDRIMPAQEFIATVKAIQYDGTNSAEIISIIGYDPTVSEANGVWETNDGMYGAVTVNVGDWYVMDGSWFTTEENFRGRHVAVSLARPGQ